MFISSDKQDIEWLLNKSLDLLRQMDVRDWHVPRAKEIIINKIEESLFWLDYKGRAALTEKQRDENES